MFGALVARVYPFHVEQRQTVLTSEQINCKFSCRLLSSRLLPQSLIYAVLKLIHFHYLTETELTYAPT